VSPRILRVSFLEETIMETLELEYETELRRRTCKKLRKSSNFDTPETNSYRRKWDFLEIREMLVKQSGRPKLEIRNFRSDVSVENIVEGTRVRGPQLLT
jgi:hypothetical protein